MSEPVPPLPSYAELVALVGELRAELAAARAEIAELRAENIELRRENVELRRRLGLNSRNSSKPPSSDGLAKPAPKSLRERSGRGPGKPTGSVGGTLLQVEDPDERVVHVPEQCAGCGGTLDDAIVVSSAARQVLDQPALRPYVGEQVLVTPPSTGCGHVTAAPAPTGVNAPVQYGPGVKAAGVYLWVRHHLPWQRCALLLADLLGTAVTAAALREWTAKAATAVAGFTAVVRKRIIDAPVAGFDETGARVEGRTRWIHTAVTDTFTAYLLHDKRGTVAFDAMGILPAFAGTAVHDGWKPYKTYTGIVHALCNAHHLRELAGVTEADRAGQAWATDLAALLKQIWNDRKQHQIEGATAFTTDALDAYQDRYQQVIDAGHAANPPSQGRKRSRAQNLLHRLDTERDQVLRFAADWRVPFDNNTGEQAIRMAKIQVNVSHGWRTIQGARRFLALRSYLETAKKHDLDLHDTLARLYDGRGTWIPTPHLTSYPVTNGDGGGTGRAVPGRTGPATRSRRVRTATAMTARPRDGWPHTAIRTSPRSEAPRHPLKAGRPKGHAETSVLALHLLQSALVYLLTELRGEFLQFSGQLAKRVAMVPARDRETWEGRDLRSLDVPRVGTLLDTCDVW